MRKILGHAERHIPLYAEVFKKAGVSADKVNSLRDLEKFPIMSKRSFRGMPVEQYIDNSRPHREVWATTSGTSGEPFTFVRRENAADPMYGYSLYYRFLYWRRGLLFGAAGTRIAKIKVRTRAGANKLYISIAEFLEDEEGTIQRLAAFRPQVIESYPSILLRLAASALQVAENTLRPEFLISAGEQLSPSARDYLQSVFKAEVYNRYALEEVGVIGTECRLHDGLHIHVESVVVEVVDETGAIVPDGGHGRVIVTDLFNYTMPFIRYDTGDNGLVVSTPCACGMETPRIYIEGRYSTYLTFGGRDIHHLEFDLALDTFMNTVIQYQVVKKTEDRLVVNVVPGDTFSSLAAREIQQAVQKLVPGIEVSVETVTEIPLNKRGKSRIVVDESTQSLSNSISRGAPDTSIK